jgi:hypothetical protein
MKNSSSKEYESDGSDGAADAWEDVNLQIKTTGTESTMV